MMAVCVYCASSRRVAQCYVDCATAVGTLLAQKGIGVINGAGAMGLMRATADGALSCGGVVTGVIPHFMVEQGWCYDAITERVEVETMHQRKAIMTSRSSGIIALPGGIGTLDELIEAITWKQLGIYLHPIVILNLNGYFDPLLAMLKRAIDERFMCEQQAAMWSVAHTPEEAVELVLHTPQWDKSIQR